ncbi:hypothetical protein [Actinomadura viridis]|uniref:Uncharacterized protein n=1 Tax=Actinomadura viridis TaxID=58110 RepID=A0A931GPI0_9ACTN|nr:hypothetical protein [Actinomadura viridis]MBG6087424.1 hypothetical protein [Actinomadura viridis]
MISTLTKSAPTLAPACPGSPMSYGGALATPVTGSLRGGAAVLRGGTQMPYGAMPVIEWSADESLGGRLRDLRGLRAAQEVQEVQAAQETSTVQEAQVAQGTSVFEQRFEGANPSAPATAHVDATSIKGGSGPYPWRRPV